MELVKVVLVVGIVDVAAVAVTIAVTVAMAFGCLILRISEPACRRQTAVIVSHIGKELY